MKLIETFDKMPGGRPNRVTFAVTASGEMRELKAPAKLTPAERLLKRYRTFYQVDMNDQSVTDTFDARSATGRYSFGVTIEVDFRVNDARAVVEGKQDVDQHLVRGIRRTATGEAGHYEASDYHALQMKLFDILDPGRTGDFTRGPFEVISVAVRVDPPDGIKLDTEAFESTRNLDLRIADALAVGDTQAAENMSKARAFIENLKHAPAQDLGARADTAQEIQRKIDQMLQEGVPRGSIAIKALQAKLEDYVSDGLDKTRLEDKSADAKDKDEDAPKDYD